MTKTSKTNPIDDGLAECVVAFVRERHNLVIGASSAATLAAARRSERPAEAIGDPLTVTGADPETGAARVEIVDPLALSAYVDEKVHASNVTDETKAVLRGARDGAAAAGHAYIGQEHLLSAILQAPAGEAVLAACGVDPQAVLEMLGPYLESRDGAPAAVPCWTPRAVRALNLAQAEARARAMPLVDLRCLLVGVVADGEGLGAAALGAAGVGLERIRAGL